MTWWEEMHPSQRREAKAGRAETSRALWEIAIFIEKLEV